jgi:hypothetical protein
MRMQASSLVLAAALVVGSVGVAAAQGIGGGETKTPNSPVTNPNTPGIDNPNSPAASNRGDPGTEPINPSTGGATMGQGTPRDRGSPSTPGGTQLPNAAKPNGR